MKESISFDRAAAYYDATRGLPEPVASAITRAFMAEIRSTGAEQVLEVGIGTGRMARPLMREGVRMVGVDISRQMMGRLAEQLTPGHRPPDLILGDATALPLRDGSFRAAIAVHVLHLVKSVEGALYEVRRVLAPGGVLMQQTRRPDAETERRWDASYDAWEPLLARRGFHRRRRRGEMLETREAVRATGATLRITDVIDHDYVHSVGQVIEELRSRIHSWTWEVPDDVWAAALPEYEEWFLEHYGPPEAQLVDRQTYELEVWTW